MVDLIHDRVYRYNGTSWNNGFAGPSGATGLSGVTVDPENGDILVSDFETDRIYRHNGTSWDSGFAVPSGALIPYGVAVYPTITG